MSVPLERFADDDQPSRWKDALLAAQFFAMDPAGLRGVAVRADPGPVLDLWYEGLRALLARGTPVKRLPAGIEDDRLLGGVDLVATLGAGRPIMQAGVLAEADGGIVVIPMAERLSSGVAARIASVLDRGELAVQRDGIAKSVATRFGVVAFDESVSDEEEVPAALLERFAFHIDLRSISSRGLDHRDPDAEATSAARARLTSIETASDDVVEALVATASALGIDSVVAPLLALRVARCAAALAGRRAVTTEDAVLAARLVLAPRARVAPATDEADDDDDPRNSPNDADSAPEQAADGDSTSDPSTEVPSLDEIMLAAVRTALPSDLLEWMGDGAMDRRPATRRQGRGGTQASYLRGRPAGTRLGAIRPGSRLALVETLRAAAPWQGVRRAAAPDEPSSRILVRRDDFRIKKFVQRRESTIVFCVDASGSTAFHRLAESKGAVELLLGQAYASRTYAALVVFRGMHAEVQLPPTRSLARAKSLLANIPGGGGTPLAAGIDAAVAIALSERAKGRAPLIVLLTDGRANIARDGTTVRTRAAQDTLDAARQLEAQGIAAIFVDTSPRPRGEAAKLALEMGARYVTLPYLDSSSVRDVVLAEVHARAKTRAPSR